MTLGVAVTLGVPVAVEVSVAVTVRVGVPVAVGEGVGVAVGVLDDVGVAVLVGVGVGVGVVSSTITSSSAGPQAPGIVLRNESVVVAPALGARLEPSVCDIQPGLLPSPVEVKEKFWLMEPKLTVSVLVWGDGTAQFVMLVLAARANVTL